MGGSFISRTSVGLWALAGIWVLSLLVSSSTAGPAESPCGERVPWNQTLVDRWDETLRENAPALVGFVHGHPPFQLFVRPANFDLRMFERLLRETEYALEVAAVRLTISHIVSDGETCGFVDIGANAGYVSLVAAALGCTTDAIEASPATARLTQRSFDLNAKLAGSLRLHTALVGPGEGSVPFAMLRSGSIYDRMVSEAEAKRIEEGQLRDPNWREWGNFTIVRVPSRPVRDLVRSAVVHMVKMDCEGCEAQAIEAMEPLLAVGRIKMILSEWVTHRIAHISGQAALDGAIRLLRRTGYRYYSWSGLRMQWAELLDNSTEVGDLFFVHRSVQPIFESQLAAARTRGGFLGFGKRKVSRYSELEMLAADLRACAL